MKRFAIKLALFISIVCALQYGIARQVPYVAPVTATSIRAYKDNKADVVFFGDSSVTWSSKYDSDKRSTAAILASLIKNNHTVGELSHNSYHAGVYDLYTKFMNSVGYTPSYIIIPINLRSFQPEWDLRPGFQFMDEYVYVHLYNSVLSPYMALLINLAVPEVDRYYESLYAQSPVHDGDRVVGNGKSYEYSVSDAQPQTVRYKAMFQMFYLGNIPKNQRKLQSLIHIADRYRGTKTQVVFYITPIDVEAGNGYFGTRFTKQVARNAQLISDILKAHQAMVLDLSQKLPTNNFIWHEVTYINEHLDEKGRNYVASILASALESERNE